MPPSIEHMKRASEFIPPAQRWRVSYSAAVTDFLILFGAGWIASHLHAIWQFIPAIRAFAPFSLLTFAVLPLNAAWGLYARLRISFIAVLLKTATGILIVLALEAIVARISPGAWFPVSVAVILAFLPASLLTRLILAKSIRWQQSRPHNIQHVVIVGLDPNICADLGRKVEAIEDRCRRIVAFFGYAEENSRREENGAPHFENIDGLLGYLTHNPADVVLFASAPEGIPDAVRTVASILELGIAVGELPGFYSPGLVGDREDVTATQEFAGLPIVQFQTVRQAASYLFFKRLVDIAVAAAALLMLSPVFLVIGALVKVTSRGPIFYPWKVLGRNRRPFVGYKFRTMVPDADEMKKELMDFNEMTGPVFKMRNDPRITQIGRWLRKYSLDELPQLYSVLKGDMSLVGPRPPSKSESDRFEFWQHRKLSVKPGITCLWQISGRSEISDFSEWARLDMQYIAAASFALDLKILLCTVPAVLNGHGAY